MLSVHAYGCQLPLTIGSIFVAVLTFDRKAIHSLILNAQIEEQKILVQGRERSHSRSLSTVVATREKRLRVPCYIFCFRSRGI
jgi:hypothetical protein